MPDYTFPIAEERPMGTNSPRVMLLKLREGAFCLRVVVDANLPHFASSEGQFRMRYNGSISWPVFGVSRTRNRFPSFVMA